MKPRRILFSFPILFAMANLENISQALQLTPQQKQQLLSILKTGFAAQPSSCVRGKLCDSVGWC